MQTGWNPQGPAGGPGAPNAPMYTAPGAGYGAVAPAGAPPQGFAPPAAPPPRAFFGALFDFSFTSFVTPRLLKVLYGLHVAALALAFLVVDAKAIETLSSSYSYSRDEAMRILAASPFALLFAVLVTRAGFELVAVLFRIAHSLEEIDRKTRG